MNTQRHSSAATYRARQAKITALLGAMAERQAAHAGRAAQRPGDWGFPGDLGAVQARLEEVLAFMGGATH